MDTLKENVMFVRKGEEEKKVRERERQRQK